MQVIACRRRGPVFLLAVGLIWSAFWALQVQQIRFYLVGLPPLLALGFWGMDQRLNDQTKRWVLAVAGLGTLLWLVLPWSDSNQVDRDGPMVELWQRQQTGPYLLGDVTADEVLESVMPWTYRPYQELGEYVPEEGKIWLVYARAHTYYLERDYKLDCVFEDWRFVADLMAADTAEIFVDQLRNDGVTHLLINHGSFLHPLDPDVPEELRQRFAALREGGWIIQETHWMIGRDPDYLQPMVLYRAA